MSGIFNPKVKEYFKFKGKLNSFAFLDMIGAVPHPGQVEILEAYETKLPPSQGVIDRGAQYGLDLDFEYKYNTLVACCGRRFGKSKFCAWLASQELLIPQSNVLLASGVLENCDIIFKDVRDILKNNLGIEPVVENNQKKLLEFENGAKFSVASVDNCSGKLGNGFSLMILDEFKLFQKSLYEEVLRPMMADHWPYSRSILITSPAPGWSETYYNYGQSFKFTKIFSVNYPSWVNPTVTSEWIEEQRQLLPPDTFAQEIEGKFTSTAGRVFPEFTRERNVREENYYPHLWDWVKNGNVTVNSIDSGYTHYFGSVNYVYVEEIDTYIVFNEYTKNKTLTSEHAKTIKLYEKENEFEPELRFADPAAAQQIADLAEHELYYNRAEKNIRESIQLCNSLFYQKSEITGESKLIILDCCFELIRQLQEVMWKEGQDNQVMEKSNTGVKCFVPDRNMKTDWDLIDAFRYGIYSFAKNNSANISIFDLDSTEDSSEADYYNKMAELGYVLNT